MPKKSRRDDLIPPDEEQAPPEAEETALMREQLEEALREKEQFRTMAQRAQADLVNYKRRAAEEQAEVRRTASSQLVLKVLAIVDDLNRAIALVPDDAVAPGWLDGLRLVQRNLDQLLYSEGVTKIEAEGRPFEPREHEAVYYEEAPDAQEGMVVSVVRDGYKLQDRVLRAAQVTVSKMPEPEDQLETNDQEA